MVWVFTHATVSKSIPEQIKAFFGVSLPVAYKGARVSNILSMVSKTNIHTENPPEVYATQNRNLQKPSHWSSKRSLVIEYTVSGNRLNHKTIKSDTASINKNTDVEYFRRVIADKTIIFIIFPKVPTVSTIKGKVLHNQ